ncbi:MAG TPA: D-aminoacyl-tRNA deacylase [Candidatus Baltobacteraceae bacterium]|nr:D-aminoacyl-tRNA deacylase [Candidatus Baltobacteraceae bacterium]
MRAVVQRVARAVVRVNDRLVGAIDAGLAVLVSVGVDDDESDAHAMSEKIGGLRIFNDEDGKMNRSIEETRGAILLVSQFTLHGDVRRGRRPSFVAAAKEPAARTLYELVGSDLERRGLHVAYGEFGASMEVEILNCGPVTILLDTKRVF